ncbi:universal stress protein UspA-like protein [Streptomyces noursei ATCC 11455]|uniref:universal stress protein n=1 Tax=Streptomyces noursei TaxID=1971 RepID=UPI00081C4B40|nr:universal stress protein UspA-like protein [Streptomyces noursei ATCC 11455]
MTSVEGRRSIVVGVDPDPSQRTALAWAADQAARRRMPLCVVHAEGVPTGGYRKTEVRPSWEEWNQSLHEAGERVLEDAVAFVENRQPQVRISALLAEGRPAWVLREQARDAAEVVLGSRHLGRVQEVFNPASVALPVMAHVSCPVVVVPEAEHVTQDPPYVVVGVDGSAHSAAAVDIAFQQAALHGAVLRAVYVRSPERFRVRDEDTVEGEYRSLLSETVAGRTATYPEVELHHEVVLGHPVEALAKASAHALCLVVGTRGRGGFTGMLLGSVSQGLLHYAQCPVIAVPQPEKDTT